MNHSRYLREALRQANKARTKGQNPIGCVIVDENGKVIAHAHNEVYKRSDKRAHAEMLAIDQAIRAVGSENARSWTLYTTIEPCIMCLCIIIMCNIGTVVWGANDIYMKAHELLTATPYMKTRKLTVIACPNSDIERECKNLHDEYWISIGRPDAIKPIQTEN